MNALEAYLKQKAHNPPVQRGMEVVVVPYRSDNYGFLVHLPTSGATVAIDAGDDAAYLAVLEQRGWCLGWILLTHHHDDHVSHAGPLAEQTGAQIMVPEDLSALGKNNLGKSLVADGSIFTLGDPKGAIELFAFASPGHTLDMVNYYIAEAEAVFTGDTLFTLGCGRLFEGTPKHMFKSLQTLKALPPSTQVYGAHEYTRSNLAFALLELPDHPPLLKRAAELRALRTADKPTVPSLLGSELKTNPFLMAETVEEFARLRKAKDQF